MTSALWNCVLVLFRPSQLCVQVRERSWTGSWSGFLQKTSAVTWDTLLSEPQTGLCSFAHLNRIQAEKQWYEYMIYTWYIIYVFLWDRVDDDDDDGDDDVFSMTSAWNMNNDTKDKVMEDHSSFIIALMDTCSTVDLPELSSSCTPSPWGRSAAPGCGYSWRFSGWWPATDLWRCHSATCAGQTPQLSMQIKSIHIYTFWFNI